MSLLRQISVSRNLFWAWISFVIFHLLYERHLQTIVLVGLTLRFFRIVFLGTRIIGATKYTRNQGWKHFNNFAQNSLLLAHYEKKRQIFLWGKSSPSCPGFSRPHPRPHSQTRWKHRLAFDQSQMLTSWQIVSGVMKYKIQCELWCKALSVTYNGFLKYLVGWPLFDSFCWFQMQTLEMRTP